MKHQWSFLLIAKQKMDKRWSLEGMTALVTGGAGGIGFVFLPIVIVFNGQDFK